MLGTRERYLLALICLAVLCAILTLGLWPFHAPRNEVAWLENRNGVRLGSYGTMISSSALKTETAPHDAGDSLEVWLQPRQMSGGGTFLTLHASGNPLPLSLSQSLSDLELRAEKGHGGLVHFYVGNVFHRSRPVFITITSGLQGTAVYVQGELASQARGFRLSANDLPRTVILGDSFGQSDPWSGQLFGVAVYHCDLSAPQVLRHYQTWTQQGRPQIAEGEHNAALYLFDEHTGNLVHNRAGAGANLYIPEKYTVLDQTLLEPVWREFGMSSSYWTNAVKNIVGFVPLGFFFYLYFSSVLRTKRVAILVVFSGFAVSLVIEVLQAYLPTRDSGTTDLITNTLGTWIGVASYRFLAPTLVRFFEWLLRPVPRIHQ
jgi:hypothetical protein